MRIVELRVQGLRDLPRFEAEGLGPLVRVRGPEPGSTALGDALELAFAALDAGALRRLLRRWELLGPGEEPEITGEPFPVQARWADRRAARALVGEERAIRVELAIWPDEALFAELRARAARAPRLVAALAESPVVRLHVGALFASSLDAVAFTARLAGVGGERFEGEEPPPWAARLLARMAGAFHRHDPSEDPAAIAAEAVLSAEGRAGWLRWEAALEGRVRPARGAGGRPVLLVDEAPARRWGEAWTRRAAVAASLHLRGAAIAWVDGEALPEEPVGGEGAPHQLFHVVPDGELVARPAPEEPPRPLLRLEEP